MTLKRRMQSILPEPSLELRAPRHEPLVCFRRETQIGNALLIPGRAEIALGADDAPIEPIKRLEGAEGGITGLAVWLAVHVDPACRNVRPDHEAETLDQAVIAATPSAHLDEVLGDAPRLCASEHRQADGVDVQVEPAPDAVERVGRVARSSP